MVSRTTFIQGALILVIAGFLNRILGFVYRVFSVRIVGPEGIGLFEMVFPIYTLILVITTAGVPLAISKLVSEQITTGNYKQAQKIFRVSLVFLIIMGALFAAALLALTPVLVRSILSDPRVYWCLLTLAPAIFIISISSAFRGYFQGLQQMAPPALGQIFEQIVRVTSSIFLANRLLPYGIEFGVAGLAAGTVLGEFIGLIFLLVVYFTRKNNFVERFNNTSNKTSSIITILINIFGYSIPISLSRVVSSVLMTLQAILIPQRLQMAGYTFRQATEIYGQFSGIALTLLGLPTIITFSLATTLVPAISEASAKKNHRLLQDRSYKAIQISLIAGLPAAVLFFLLPEQLCSIIFGTPGAGKPLQIMALGCLFLYLAQTTSGILQGLGKVGIHLCNSLLGALLNLLGIYYLTALPTYGIMGTALAMNFSWIAISVLNIIAVINLTKISFDIYKLCIMPVIGIFVMGSITYLVYNGLWILSRDSFITILGSMLVGGITYIFYLFLSGIITKEDIAKIPGIGFLFNNITL